MTAVTGTMVVGASPEDLVAAQKLVSTSPGYLSKWTKSELVSAAIALRLFIRELPGGPKLLRRAMDLAKSPNGGEDERMARAIKAINCQEGVDASLYRPTQTTEGSATATSTQSPAGTSAPRWDDLSQIPSNQEGEEDGATVQKGESDGVNISGGGTALSIGGDGSGGGDGEVSDHSSSSVHSLAAPDQLAFGPHAGAKVGGLVDGDMNGSGVTRVGGVGDGNAARDVGADRRVRDAPPTETTAPVKAPWRPRVCNRVWKGKICNSRTSGCRFAHPDPCRSSRCTGNPAAGCKAFHPHVRGVETSVTVVKGNDKGSVRKGGAAPNRNVRDKKAPRPSSSSSGSNSGNRRSGNGGSRSSGSNSNNRNSNHRLPQVSYRDVAARAVPSTMGCANGSGNSGGSNNSIPYFRAQPAREGGGYAHAQLDPAVLSTVVAAVMTVLAGGNQQLF